MPDEKIEVNYVRWRLGNSYKCKELLASFLTALSLIYAFYLIAVSPPPAQKLTDRTCKIICKKELWVPSTRIGGCHPGGVSISRDFEGGGGIVIGPAKKGT
jgi:hypothetical protein